MRYTKFAPYTALSVIASIVLLLSPKQAIAQDAIMATKPTGRIVGAMIPLTGRHKNLGKMINNAVEMAWYTYAPKNLTLKIYDTKSSNTSTKDAYDKAFLDGVKMIVGPLTSSNTSTIRNHSNASITNLSLSNDTSNAASNIFIMGYSPQSQGMAIAQILKKQDFTRAIAIIPKNKFGDGIMQGLGFSGSNRIIKTMHYDANVQDFTSIVKYIIKNKSDFQYDAIILPDGNPKTIQILAGQLAFYDAQDPYEESEDGTEIKHKKKVKVTDQIPMIGGLGWHALNGAYKEPPLLNGYYIEIPNTSRKYDFDAQYKKLYGKSPTPLARLTFDAMALSIIASTSDNPQDKLRQSDGHFGISGIFKMGSYGAVNRDYRVMRVGRTKSTYKYSVTVGSH